MPMTALHMLCRQVIHVGITDSRIQLITATHGMLDAIPTPTASWQEPAPAARQFRLDKDKLSPCCNAHCRQPIVPGLEIPDAFQADGFH